jgi:hypothetical protein
MNTDLIKNTGIQFISIPISLDDKVLNSVIGSFSEKIEERSEEDLYTLLHPYYWKEEEMYLEYDTINDEAINMFGEIDSEQIRSNYVTEIDSEDIFKVRGSEVLGICEGHWIPLPFFRIRRDPKAPFHHGPENWCRGNLQRFDDPDKVHTHVLTLAFDTATEDVESSTDYKRPRSQDASDNGSERFKCVLDKRTTRSFFTNEGLSEWMFNLYWLDPEGKSEKNKLRYLAVYHVYLDLLDKANALPEVGLLSGDNAIDVGLTLDIGNSRTCGLICEKNRPYDNSPFDFTSARKLQIRNLSKPHEICEKPFDMQVAFAEEKFGNQAVDQFEDVFQWPSLVRVGDEAIGLTSIFESQDSLATMSSPKRYLWDKAPVKVPWIKVDRDGRLGYHENVDIRKYALFGFAEYITSSGELIKEKDRDRVFGATESRYSKASLMTFAIYEILLHAICQINSYEFREDQGNSTYRRQLKDVVLTCPTAMTDQEQHSLRKSAMDAVTLLKNTVGERIDLSGLTVFPKLPNLDPEDSTPNPWKFDEATCSQLSYLYGEIVQKFNSNKELFFGINGKLRSIDDSEPEQSVTVASIDIGGGTSDLMICNYSYDKEADVPYITPTPLFWEGFNIAGDDIVKRVVEFILIPEIERNLKNSNASNISSTLNELFGPNIGGQTATERIYRRQFANQVAMPFAFEALEYVRFNDSKPDTITLNDVFEKHAKPESGLLEYIGKKIAKNTGVVDFSICDIEINLDPRQINHGIEDIMGDVLKQLSFLIAQFECDLILLSGRPSRLPIMHDILSSTLSFSPDKIVCLGDYRFGHWYPFANSTGYVGDPKSTVCVGALIGYLNSTGRLPGLRIDLEPLDKIESTANFIGVMDASCSLIDTKDILLGPDKDEGVFKFYGEPITIGMKQLDAQDWISSPLYVFDFKTDEKKSSFLKHGYKYPLKVTVRRRGNKGEFISKDDLVVIDRENLTLENQYFDFTFRTSSSSEAHWKDSGSFIINIENN